MPLRVPHAVVRRSWWWVFALFIAAPAVVLAVLGFGSLRADELERDQQRRDRESRLATLVDAALANVLDDFLIDRSPSPSTAPATAPEPMPFELDANGRIRFPADRLVDDDQAGPPREARPTIPGTTMELAADAQAAEAQGRNAEARALYEQLRRQPSLRPWAELQTMLVGVNVIDEAVASRTASLRLATSDATSPTGIPLAFVAAGLTDVMTPGGRRAFGPFLSNVRTSLTSGRWWLSLDQRRAYGAELDRWLEAAGVSGPPHPDTRLAAVSQASQELRRLVTAPATSGRARMVGDGPARQLIVWSRMVQPSATRRGVVVSERHASAAFHAALDPFLRGEPVSLTVHDGTSVVWGDGSAADSPTYPLAETGGWSLAVTSTEPPLPLGRQLLEYSRVALPACVLAVGLFMTVWIVRREMALTAMRSSFVAAVTHEFKSPITSIRLLLERLTSGRVAPGSSPERYFAAITAETDRLEQMVNRLLEAQKFQEGRREYSFRRQALETVVAEAAARLQAQAEAKRMAVDVEIAPSVPPLDLDTASFSDAVANLVDNAIKYSPAGSTIRVRADREGDRATVSVTDEGIGVSADDSARIFEPFFRSRRGDHANVHGTGLGLSLVKATAEAHGGTVTVESDGVRGSRFVLTVPLPAPDASPTTRPAAAGVPVPPQADSTRG